MTNNEAIRDAVDKIDTVARHLDVECNTPTRKLCTFILGCVARDLNTVLDQKGQKDDK